MKREKERWRENERERERESFKLDWSTARENTYLLKKRKKERENM